MAQEAWLAGRIDREVSGEAMMTAVIILTGIGTLLLMLVTYIQTLYLESLRLRTRELPALEHFKDQIADRIGVETEEGALVFSLWKHTLLVLLGVVVVGITVEEGHLKRDLAEAAVIAFLLMLLSSYVVPQLLYRKTKGEWIGALVPVVKLLLLAMRPLALLLGFLHSLAALAGKEKVEEEQTAQEEIDALIEAGTEEGIIEEDDRKLIQSVVAFGDKTVREVMTPRPSIVAIGQDQSLEDLRQLVIHEQYSRIPVFEKDIDSIVGFVHVRDMFEVEEAERPKRRVRELLREIKQVPETKPVKALLDEMRHAGAHMCVVIDEYGNAAGLATMEDLVEEILGEIRDEHEPQLDVVPEGEGVYVVSGSFDLDHLAELFEFHPDEETESTTVGGLATEWFGRVPHPGESIEREGIRLEILASNDLRVDRVRIARVPEASETPVKNGKHVATET